MWATRPKQSLRLGLYHGCSAFVSQNLKIQDDEEYKDLNTYRNPKLDGVV